VAPDDGAAPPAELGHVDAGPINPASVAASEEVIPVEEAMTPQGQAEPVNEGDAPSTQVSPADTVGSDEHDSRFSPERTSLEAVSQPPSHGYAAAVSDGPTSNVPPETDEWRNRAEEGGGGNRSDAVGLQAYTSPTTSEETMALTSAESHQSAPTDAAPPPAALEQTKAQADEVQAADSSEMFSIHQAPPLEQLSPNGSAEPSSAEYTDAPVARPNGVSRGGSVGDTAVLPAEPEPKHGGSASEDSDSERRVASLPMRIAPLNMSPSRDLETAMIASFRSSQPPTPMGGAPGLSFSLIVADPVAGPSSPPPLAAAYPAFGSATGQGQGPPVAVSADAAVGGTDSQTQEPMAGDVDTANPAELSPPSSAEQAARMTRDILTALAPRPEDVPQEEEEVWENQRRLPLSFEFSSAFLRPYERGPFSTKDGQTLPTPDQVGSLVLPAPLRRVLF
jgi:hypothetical protein